MLQRTRHAPSARACSSRATGALQPRRRRRRRQRRECRGPRRCRVVRERQAGARRRRHCPWCSRAVRPLLGSSATLAASCRPRRLGAASQVLTPHRPRDPCSCLCGGPAPLHRRVRRVRPSHRALRPRPSLPASAARGAARAPVGGGFIFPQRTRHAPRFRRVWKPGGGSLFFSSACSTKGVRTSYRAVSRDCAEPACQPSVSFANPPSRRSEPATPPLWCMAHWSAPVRLAAVGARGRVVRKRPAVSTAVVAVLRRR